METPPKYVRLCNTTLRLEIKRKRYYRDAGDWWIGYTFKDGKWYSVGWGMTDHLDNIELTEISREEYAEDNGEYLPDNY